MGMQKTVSPVDGSVYTERVTASAAEVERGLRRAEKATKSWRETKLERRVEICLRFVEAMEREAGAIGEELAWQMGRPVKYGPMEILRGFAERARYMASIAAEALADISVSGKEGFTRFIRREPVGVVFTIAPWNYPFLTAVNSVVPAVLAGNAVVLKHSAQTPLCAERFSRAFQEAGMPDGVFQHLFLDHE